MKGFFKIAVVFVLCVAVIFTAGNMAVSMVRKHSENNYYKVEINRILAAESFSPQDYKYVKAVEMLSQQPDEAELERFYRNENEDYTFVRHNGRLLRFTYERRKESNTGFYVVFNVFLAIMAVLAMGIAAAVYYRVLKPFGRITALPYELSKGNLTADIPEDKNKLFGKFIWGLNMLRENLESHKSNELALMKQKKTLILSISHDIKTPLSAIKLYAKALSRNMYSDEEKRNDVLRKIDMHTDEINNSINKIIEASSDDFLNLETINDEFYLKEMVDSIAGYYSEKLALARIGFTVREYDNCLLSGDFDRSVEVLQNLLENAIKYGDGEMIEISFSREENFCLVTVENTGCTLGETEMLHVFDSFWRGSNSSGISGSGLGLYICRTLMRNMNGDAYAEMNDNKFAVTAVFKMA